MSAASMSPMGKARKYCRDTAKEARQELGQNMSFVGEMVVSAVKTVSKPLRDISKKRNQRKMTAKAATKTVHVEASTSEDHENKPLPETAQNPMGAKKKEATSSPATSAESFTDDNNAAPTPATTTAAAKPSLGKRLVAATRRGVDKLENAIAIETTRAKAHLKRVMFSRSSKQAPAAAAEGAAAGGEVGEGSVAAAAVSAEAVVVVEESAETVTSKPTRGFFGSKAHCAAKRLREARQKVEERFESTKQGAKEQLQALKQRCSRNKVQ